MLFNSYIFLLLFLPLAVIGYFVFNHFKMYKVATAFLLGMSLWFYGYFNIRYLPLILASIVFNFLFYKLLINLDKEGLRKLILAIAILFNIGILFYFKYLDFAIKNVNMILGTGFSLRRILLPLGISFFTFQQLSLVIDSYKREVPEYNFLNYALFVTFFPQLIAGPIVTHDELVPQLTDESKRHLNWDNVSAGLFMLALGLAKKVIIADTFGNAVNYGFSNITSLNSTEGFLVMLAYTIQIYFDFSGYCDMASGMCRVMNIDLPLNFNSPYKALTITEFWDRWHMTLTRFFTKYIYIPLGGNRCGKFRMYLNTMIVFLVSGIWHGANWTFILWGGIHGLFVVLTKAFKRFFERMHPALSWLITFGFVNVTWILFRADSFSAAQEMIACIFKFDFGAISQNILNVFALPELEWLANLLLPVNIATASLPLPYLFLLLFFGVAFIMILGCRNASEHMNTFKPTVARSVVAALLLLWCIFSFSGVSTFLYFNF